MNVLAAIGREVLAPAICLHAHRLIEIVAERRIDRLYFLARDGFLLRKVYRALLPLARAPLPEDAYLHVSRRSTALAAVDRFGVREALAGARPPSTGTPASILRSLQLDDAETRALARRAGLAAFELPAPAATAELERLYHDPAFQAHVAERAQAARARLVAYLRQHLFLDQGRVAVVDVGWRGTIQDHLARAVRGERGEPEIHGVYLGLLRDGEGRHGEASGVKEGTVFDDRRARTLAELSPLHFVQLFEDATRADEGTALDYVDEDGRVEAVLKTAGADRDAERAAWPAIETLQTAILDYAHEYGARSLAGRLPPVAERRIDAQRRLERFVFEPRLDEVRAFAALSHADDWAVNRFGALAPRVGFIGPRQWVKGFYSSYWKPGYLRQTTGALSCRLFHAWERLKLRRGPRAR